MMFISHCITCIYGHCSKKKRKICMSSALPHKCPSVLLINKLLYLVQNLPRRLEAAIIYSADFSVCACFWGVFAYFFFFLVIEEGGVKMKLTVVDTPGFGDQINNDNW